MQVLAPGVGLVTTVTNNREERGRPHLYLTENDGAQWKEISQKLGDSDKIVSQFFFLDANHGWLVLWRWVPVTPSNWFWHWWPVAEPPKRAYEPAFELLYTRDSGASWSRTHMEIPELGSLRDSIQASGQIGFLIRAMAGWT